MKKTYQAPEMKVKEQAQFENVFAHCDKNPADSGCSQICVKGDPGYGRGNCPIPPGRSNSSFSSHQTI